MSEKDTSESAASQETSENREVLAHDYGEIARLAGRLDGQIKQFVGSMNSMVESIPSQDALGETWDEHVKTVTQVDGKNPATKLDPDQIVGDEAKAFDAVKLL